jgi:hypothetical protein
VTVVAGAGLLVFADPAWAHAIGAVALIACAVTVFALASGPTAELSAGRQGEAGRRLQARAQYVGASRFREVFDDREGSGTAGSTKSFGIMEGGGDAASGERREGGV